MSSDNRPVSNDPAFNSANPEFLQCPHRMLAGMREQGRVHEDMLGNSLLLTRHADIDAFLRDRRYCKDPRKLPPDHPIRRVLQVPEEPDRQPPMIFLDPPEHTRLRRLVNQAFTPAAVEERRPRIREIAHELLDAIGTKTELDVVWDYARPLPIIVIAEMLGVAIDDRVKFAEWSNEMMHGLNPFAAKELRNRALQARKDLIAYFSGAIEEHRLAPKPDLLSALVAAEENGDRLSQTELVDLCLLLLLAGNLTTTDAIGSGVLALLEHPAQLDKLRRDRSLLPRAVEEILRWEPPFTSSRRLVMNDTEVAGCPVAAGTFVHGSLPSANRDPAVFADPETFDIAREKNPHLTFGAGIHMCVAAPLARAEVQIALDVLLSRCAKIELTTPAEELQWKQIVFMRGLEKLPVRVDRVSPRSPDG